MYVCVCVWQVSFSVSVILSLRRTKPFVSNIKGDTTNLKQKQQNIFLKLYFFVAQMPNAKPAAKMAKKRTAAKDPGIVVEHPERGPVEKQRILQLREVWLNKILSNNKRAEIRGSPAKLGGTWVGRAGAVYGFAEIVKIEQANSIEEFNALESMHQIPQAMSLPYKKTYIWHLDRVMTVDCFKYKVKSGPVTWAKYQQPDVE